MVSSFCSDSVSAGIVHLTWSYHNSLAYHQSFLCINKFFWHGLLPGCSFVRKSSRTGWSRLFEIPYIRLQTRILFCLFEKDVLGSFLGGAHPKLFFPYKSSLQDKVCAAQHYICCPDDFRIYSSDDWQDYGTENEESKKVNMGTYLLYCWRALKRRTNFERT